MYKDKVAAVARSVCFAQNYSRKSIVYDIFEAFPNTAFLGMLLDRIYSGLSDKRISEVLVNVPVGRQQYLGAIQYFQVRLDGQIKDIFAALTGVNLEEVMGRKTPICIEDFIPMTAVAPRQLRSPQAVYIQRIMIELKRNGFERDLEKNVLKVKAMGGSRRNDHALRSD